MIIILKYTPPLSSADDMASLCFNTVFIYLKYSMAYVKLTISKIAVPSDGSESAMNVADYADVNCEIE